MKTLQQSNAKAILLKVANHARNHPKITIAIIILPIVIVTLLLVLFQKKPATYNDLLPHMRSANDFTLAMDESSKAYDGLESQIGTEAYNGFLGIVDENTPPEVAKYVNEKYSPAIERAKEVKERVIAQENAVRALNGVIDLSDLEYLKTRSDALPISALSTDYPTIDIETAREILKKGDTNAVLYGKSSTHNHNHAHHHHTDDNHHDHEHNHEHEHKKPVANPTTQTDDEVVLTEKTSSAHVHVHDGHGHDHTHHH